MFSQATSTTARQLQKSLAVLPERREVLATGIHALDQVLPDGGLPRARLSEITGGRSSGKRAVATALCARALGEGRSVVWIDGSGGYYPLLPLELGLPLERLIVVRTHAATREDASTRAGRRERGTACFPGGGVRGCPPALKAADILMSAGKAVDLLVIDLPPRSRSLSSRLFARLQLGAETSGAAVVFVTEQSPAGRRPARSESLGTFICLQLRFKRLESSRVGVLIAKSKLGKMAHHTVVTLDEPYSVRMDTTI